MRLIDADALVWKIKTEKGGTPAMLVAVNSIPTVDAVPVVRCKDCRYYARDNDRPPRGKCLPLNILSVDDWYCADGERREDDN